MLSKASVDRSLVMRRTTELAQRKLPTLWS